MTKLVILDGDPGQDDAVATLMALGAPNELSVLGVTAVAGNVPVDKTFANARKIVELAASRVPVYRGCAAPLDGFRLQTAEHVHGPTGLDGADIPAARLTPESETAVEFLVRVLRSAAPASITLACTGPLTNVASAFRAAPETKTAIVEIVVMLGARREGGNITPIAEFNAYVDPVAAHEVLQSGVSIRAIPLDLTHQVLTTPQRIAELRSRATRCAAVTADLIEFSQTYDLKRYGWDGAPLHDPCVVAALIEPEIFVGRELNMEVETQAELTRGATLVDWWGDSLRPANVSYLYSVDIDRVYELLGESLASLP